MASRIVAIHCDRLVSSGVIIHTDELVSDVCACVCDVGACVTFVRARFDHQIHYQGIGLRGAEFNWLSPYVVQFGVGATDVAGADGCLDNSVLGCIDG